MGLLIWRSCVSEAVGGMLVLYKMASWSKLGKTCCTMCCMHTVCQLLGWTGAAFHDFSRLQQQGAGRDETNADFAVVLRAWCCKYWAQPALLEAVRPARATPFSPGQQRRFRPLVLRGVATLVPDSIGRCAVCTS